MNAWTACCSWHIAIGPCLGELIDRLREDSPLALQDFVDGGWRAARDVSPSEAMPFELELDEKLSPFAV